MSALFLAMILALPQISPVPAAAQAPASIDGVVVRLGSGQPVARARVALEDLGSNSDERITATTNITGGFAFPNLRPSTYRLTATRPGYLTAEYGQRRSDRDGAPITLDAGQQMKGVLLVLTPTGAIAGRVYDGNGDPVIEATVQAFNYRYAEGRRLLTRAQSAKTNDLGEYRIYGIRPGQYVVSAAPAVIARASANPTVGEGANFQGQPDALQAYLPVYFPGTTDPSGAQAVDLRGGETVAGTDFMLLETRASRILAQVVDGQTGQPAIGASVTLVSRGSVISGAAGSAGSPTTNGFEFRNVVPGSYEIIATARGNSGSSRNAGAKIGGAFPIEVGAGDTSAVTLVLPAGFAVNGRLTVDTGSAPQSDGISNATVRLVSRVSQLSSSASKVGADGNFVLNGVAPGEYRLQVTGLPHSFYIKAAQLPGADLLNGPVRLDSAPKGLLDIIVSPASGILEVTVIDEKRQPVFRVPVVLVPDQPLRERFDLYRSASTDESGRVRFDGIVPGDYKVFAWEDVESGAWQNPDFLSSYERRATTVRIREHATESIAVTLLDPKL
jgi:protocatechuate 3,4-dioxygenase beta subunit